MDAFAFVSSGFATKHATVASIAFLFYDYLITLDAEMNLVWNHRWSFGKVLFIFNRYFGAFALLFNTIVLFSGSVIDPFCKLFLWWQGASIVVAILSAEVILIGRIIAVYDRSRKLFINIVILFITEIVSTLMIVGRSSLEGVAQSFDGTTGCYTTHRVTFLCWVPFLTFESILCLLMVYKPWSMRRDDYSIPPVLDMFLRDSIMYFLTIFALLLFYTFMWAFAPPAIAVVAYGWGLAMPCAIGTRLLLNMRERCFDEEATTLVSYASHRLSKESISGVSIVAR